MNIEEGRRYAVAFVNGEGFAFFCWTKYSRPACRTPCKECIRLWRHGDRS